MTLKRAQEINSAMVDHGLLRFDLTNRQDLTELTDVSLEEMITATRLVQAENRMEAAPGEIRTIHTVCDDRLIAALYVAYNYPAARDPESIDPIIQSKDGRMVVVVDERCAK